MTTENRLPSIRENTLCDLLDQAYTVIPESSDKLRKEIRDALKNTAWEI